MAEINLGSLVVAKVHPNIVVNKSNESIYYNYPIVDTVDDVPVMIVTEINTNSKRENKFNAQFGDEVGAVVDEDKCLCCWYDNDLGGFKNKYFYKNQLVGIPINIHRYDKETLPCVGTKVYLSTNEIELFKTYTNNCKPYRFKSPILIILDYKRVEDSILYDSKTGKRTKIIDSINVKCQWFNYKLGKYSEEWLPLSCLCPIDFESRLPFEFLVDGDDEVCEAIASGDDSYIPIKKGIEDEYNIVDSSYNSIERKRVGQYYEWKVFNTNNNVVLEPKYYDILEKNGWCLKYNKVFLNREKKYGQVDLIVEENGKTIIVDVIKSSIINKSDASKWENARKLDQKNETMKLLNIYLKRILEYKKILNSNRYNKQIEHIHSCYLLICGKNSEDIFCVRRDAVLE